MQLQNTKAPSTLALNTYLLHSMIFMFTILFYVLYAAAAVFGMILTTCGGASLSTQQREVHYEYPSEWCIVF